MFSVAFVLIGTSGTSWHFMPRLAPGVIAGAFLLMASSLAVTWRELILPARHFPPPWTILCRHRMALAASIRRSTAARTSSFSRCRIQALASASVIQWVTVTGGASPSTTTMRYIKFFSGTMRYDLCGLGILQICHQSRPNVWQL